MDYNIIVVGGGHAGIEAALAAARLGFKSLLITQSLDTIGRLSCNPAVGGLSKGNIVREIDALGGEMGRLIDASMIQYRILNRRRGPAVQAPRAQADKFLYNALAKETLEKQKGLDLFQDTVVDIMLDKAGAAIRGVITERGKKISAQAVVLTTGTFMEGKIFIGEYETSSGRLGEPAAVGLGTALRGHGFNLARLKTGTPARVARSSLDFSKMEIQPGDEIMAPFSFGHDFIDRPNEPCHITYTNEKTHQIIQANIRRSPLFGGKIKGVGPRYCPSIEDKVVRFSDKPRHQIFVEPEGLNSEEMYLNGISSSLPEEVQDEFLHTLPGLEEVIVMRPGYAVEYDFIDPRQLYPSLMTKKIAGFFVAGQTNGTSGYEEAGCQGLLAGINAAMYLRNMDPLILSRAEAYAGVLIDDLVTLGTNEPYRMFTSRAEYRLSLRHDNADQRLTPYGIDCGLQSPERMEKFREKQKGIAEIAALLSNRKAGESLIENHNLSEKLRGKSLDQILKNPQISIYDFKREMPELDKYPRQWTDQIELDIKYEGYLRRQERQVKSFEKMERMKIPPSFDYSKINEISKESREKLESIRPVSVGQASRISGVRNSDIAVLIALLSRSK